MKKELKKIILIVIPIFFVMPLSALAMGLTTYNATNIGDTYATFNGNFSIENEDKEVPTWFEWFYYDFGDNDERYGTEEINHVAGDFSYTRLGLRPNTTYYYRACFERSGTYCQQGYTVSFTTLPESTAPEVHASITTTEIQSKSAILRGTCSANGRDAEIWFEYGEADGTVEAPVCSSDFLDYETMRRVQGALAPPGSMQETIRNLQPQTPYCFRIVGENEKGTAYSPIQSFSTGSVSLLGGVTEQIPDTSDAALSISTKGVTGVGSTSATLLGSAIPSAINETKTYFRYSAMPIPPVFCNELYGSNMKSSSDINLGKTSEQLWGPIKALIDSNVNGNNDAIIKGLIANLPQKLFSQNISGLRPDTTYYYCAIASTRKNIAYGNNQTAFSFTTLPCETCDPTSIKTEKATSITTTSAVLNAFYNSTKPIKVWFQYILNPTVKPATNSTASSPAASTQKATAMKAIKTLVKDLPAGNGPVSIGISGLQANKIYRYWAVAKRSDGPEIKGSTLSFTAKPTGNSGPCGPNTAPNIYALPEASVYTANPRASTAGGQGLLATNWQMGLGPVNVPYVGVSSTKDSPSPSSLPTGCTSTAGYSTTTGKSCSILSATSSVIGMSKAQTDYISQLFEGITLATPNILPTLVAQIDTTPRPRPRPISYLDSINFSENPCNPVIVNPPPKPAILPTGETSIIIHGTPTTPWIPGTPLALGQTATPPVDAIVRYHEGVETVFARQIIANAKLAKIYGYDEGTNLQAFAWNLADLLARAFGYVNKNGKEIRVSKPDIAAYELRLEGYNLTVYEYYNSKIINIQKTSSLFKNAFFYEYYFWK